MASAYIPLLLILSSHDNNVSWLAKNNNTNS